MKLVALVGPTAAGKSALALHLAERFQGAIVSADSVQVYRGFDIGSAKPTLEERQRVPHALIDIVAPDEEFTAADYAKFARQALARFQSESRLSIVVGGTGFYFRSLVEGLLAAPGKDARVRAQLEALPTDELRGRLGAVDPAWAGRIGAGDRYRLIRALEIYLVSGKPPSFWAAEQQRGPSPASAFDVLWIGLAPDRLRLYERIDARVECMWKGGWLDEVWRLVEAGYAHTRPMRSVGYAEVFSHLFQGIAYAQAMALAKKRTRNYAKRQFTWFRANRAVHWFDPDRPDAREAIWALIERWMS